MALVPGPPELGTATDRDRLSDPRDDAGSVLVSTMTATDSTRPTEAGGVQ